ncbi:MAG TPA: PAS domain S-box protein, partial [Longimicrobiales bacterium]|nr:PAS domain S-box protein [Longimicrobiales bacterium]
VMILGAADALRESRLQQLDGLVESKEEALELVLSGWDDRVRLIASRTQLRQSLREHARTADAEARIRIRRILADALAAVSSVESLAIDDLGGGRIAVVSREGARPPPPVARATVPGGEPRDSVSYEGISFVGDRATVVFRTDLVLDGERLGVLHVSLVPRELFDLVGVRTGLGETGEAMIVLPSTAGTVRILRPSAGGGARLSGPADTATVSDPVRWALEGREGRFHDGTGDATGEPVWAALRSLPRTGWGLVVKLDAREGGAPVVALRDHLTSVGLSLAAFAILAGVVLGFRFARPILDLTAVAARIREGELTARADVTSQDEVGALARTFNQMAEELEDRMNELKEFHTFFELSLDLLCIAGTDGYFKRVNPAFQRILGWTPEALLSRPITDFVHPADVEATRGELARLADGRPTISFENRFRRADGSYRWLRWTCHPEPGTGLLYAAARDVTSRSPEGEERPEGEEPSEREAGSADDGSPGRGGRRSS